MTYAKTSPYADTNVAAGNYLGILDVRPVPKTANDVLYEIEPIFHQRPDLAAHAIYGNNKLWWTFAQRNPDILIDPVFDFKAGTRIYLLHGPTLREILGI